MALAVFSDVHANLPALAAVLEDVERLGIEDVVSLGDAVGFGPSPEAVVRLLRKRAIPSLLGNHEEAVLGTPKEPPPPAVAETAAWTRDRLDASSLEWIRRLPRERRLLLDGKAFVLLHASPGSRTNALDLDADEADLREALVAARADALVVGHTHRVGLREVAKRIVANPGSVGLSFDGPEATYLVFDGKDVAERRVAYDVEAFTTEMLKEKRPLDTLPAAALRHLPAR